MKSIWMLIFAIFILIIGLFLQSGLLMFVVKDGEGEPIEYYDENKIDTTKTNIFNE